MPNGQFNPLATLATSARQMNEQANQVVKSLGDSFTQTTNQLLASAAQGLPPLPPLPGMTQGNGSKNGNGSNPGNGNGGPFPSLQQLVPAQALQAVSQVEDVVFPAGFPRPSQVFLGAARPKRQTMEQPPAEHAQPPAMAGRQPGLGVGGLNGHAESKRPGKALGIQAT